ncbi:MAG: phospho-N-acetylmuramoyl-pentapeptide-transferase [Candidatus Schekmanbacteria bacterium]|nr:MAG: phospho-N-acetylmuramoyl-pentapeptide-transferase [Candidatus Schekmanbacteria bacterium]
MVTAFIIAILTGPSIIRFLRRKSLKDIPREEIELINPSSKEGTPTMGGLLIIISMILPAILWCNLFNMYTQIIIAATVWFSALGIKDDLIKVREGRKDGMSKKEKIFWQASFGLILALIMVSPLSPVGMDKATHINFPFYKYSVDIGWLYVPFVIFVIMATSNAVNFADGLDGLAIGPSILTAMVFGVFAYVLSNLKLAKYFQFEFLNGAGELAVFSAAFIGAGIGFLWFNSYPAQVFMGDTGSMMIGGVLGTIAVLIKQEFLFIIAGIVFVAEAASVFIQMVFINYIGRRLFLMAPIHHSFQKRGIAEPKVVIRFWIISAIFALIALSTLKIR